MPNEIIGRIGAAILLHRVAAREEARREADLARVGAAILLARLGTTARNVPPAA